MDEKPILEIHNRCIKCDLCRQLCPENSVLKESGTYLIENWSCTLCGLCVEVCPVDAIRLISQS